MSWDIRQGDALERLREMEAESVQTVVTSPPYWGLRSYGTEPKIWGGDPHHDHQWHERRYYVEGGGGAGSSAEAFSEAGEANAERIKKARWREDACCECGAWSGNLGLEPTPEQYVANLVEVFREVRRVLRKDGTVWLNLGDSYAGGFGSTGRNDTERETPGGRGGSFQGGERRPLEQRHGLKPKDLVGIPWRTAFALQQPYYAGRIKDERDRIWLAAMIDAEGCMFIHRRKEGQSNGQGYYRKQDGFGAGLEVSSTDRVIVERCMAITGLGSICEQSPEQNKRRKQTIYRWNLRSNICREVVREIYPYLTAKQHEARLLCGCPPSGTKARDAWEALKAIHQGGEHPDIDFPAPESMFEGGWYLRSDCIWSKLAQPDARVGDGQTDPRPRIHLPADQEREVLL